MRLVICNYCPNTKNRDEETKDTKRVIDRGSRKEGESGRERGEKKKEKERQTDR